MKQEFINERRSSACRKFIYTELRNAGITIALASRIRDWRLPAVIRKIAEAKKIEYAFAHYDFYTALSKQGIELWRETIIENEVELSPEEDHEPEE